MLTLRQSHDADKNEQIKWWQANDQSFWCDIKRKTWWYQRRYRGHLSNWWMKRLKGKWNGRSNVNGIWRREEERSNLLFIAYIEKKEWLNVNDRNEHWEKSRHCSPENLWTPRKSKNITYRHIIVRIAASTYSIDGIFPLRPSDSHQAIKPFTPIYLCYLYCSCM